MRTHCNPSQQPTSRWGCRWLCLTAVKHTSMLPLCHMGPSPCITPNNPSTAAASKQQPLPNSSRFQTAAASKQQPLANSDNRANAVQVSNAVFTSITTTREALAAGRQHGQTCQTMSNHNCCAVFIVGTTALECGHQHCDTRHSTAQTVPAACLQHEAAAYCWK
jgi:hypothetical protein